jgi:hypothetical protein
MTPRLQITLLTLLAAVAIVLVSAQDSERASASDLPTFDCNALGAIVPVAICQFDNVTASNANDIHVVFDGFVVNLIDSPLSACRASRQGGRAGIITTYNCRFVRRGAVVPPGGTYTMLVLFAGSNAHVSSWHWTLNGTPFPNTTPTNTPTPAAFPDTPTPTPEPFVTHTPTPTAGSLPPTPTATLDPTED